MCSDILLSLASNCQLQTVQNIYVNMELGVIHLWYGSQIQRNIWWMYKFLDIEVRNGGDTV